MSEHPSELDSKELTTNQHPPQLAALVWEDISVLDGPWQDCPRKGEAFLVWSYEAGFSTAVYDHTTCRVVGLMDGCMGDEFEIAPTHFARLRPLGNEDIPD